MPVGRKPRYDESSLPDLCKRAEALARQGMIDREIAQALNLSLSRYYEYQKKFQEFRESILRGKIIVDRNVESSLLRRALGYETEDVEAYIDKNNHLIKARKLKKHVPPDVKACIFWLKNRKPKEWRDKQVTESSGIMEVPSGLNKEDLDALWAELSAGTILES